MLGTFGPLFTPLAAGVGGALATGGVQRVAGRRAGLLKVSARLQILVPALIGAVWAAGISWLAVLEYGAMHMRMPDLAAYDQTLWATIHGHPFHVSIWVFPQNYLGFQVLPVMALLSPLALLFHDARVLMVTQTVGIAAGVLPVALWARQRLGGFLPVLFVSLAYFLNPALAHAAGQPFHQITLAIPLLGFALLFQLNRRWLWFWLCFVLALTVKDEIALVGIAMAAYALICQRAWRQGAAMLLISAVWAWLCLAVILPSFNGAGHSVYFVDSFGYLGASTPAGVAVSALTHPGLVLGTLLQPPKVYFALYLVATLGLLPLVGWRISAVALMTLAYLIAENSPSRYDPSYYYAAPMIPFLFFGAIDGIARLRGRLSVGVLSGYLLGVSVLAFHWFGAGPGSTIFRPADYQSTPHTAVLQRMLADIPPAASVSANTNVIAHLSRRMDLYLFPDTVTPTDYVAIDLTGFDGWQAYPADFTQDDAALRRVLQDPAYSATYYGDGVILLRRNQPLPPPPIQTNAAFGPLTLVGGQLPASAQPGQDVTLHLRWRADAPVQHPYTAFVHIGPTGGATVIQQDAWPWQGHFPTDQWAAGEQVDDPRTLHVPPATPPGRYEVRVGLYWNDAGTLHNLLTPAGDSSVVLGTLQVQ